jgi:tyrosinase
MSLLRTPILLLALAATVLVQSVLASGPYDYGVDRDKIIKRQTVLTGFYAITGIEPSMGLGGSVGVRKEIRVLEQDPVMWTLYILGLDTLQYTDQSDMLSWYQIAGLSTFPFSWSI